VPAGVAVYKLAAAGDWPAFDARSLRLMLNSLGVAGGAAAIACLLGAPVGFGLGRMRSRGERLLACAAAVPFLMPPYVAAIAWIDLTGIRGIASLALGRPIGPIFSPAGAAWVLGTSYLTIPAAAVALAARSGAWSGIDPARHARGAFAVFTRIVVPATWPYLVGAGALVFLISLAEFAVPSLLQVAVYPVEIHARFAADYDVPGAIAASVPVVAIGLLTLAAVAAYLRRVPRPLADDDGTLGSGAGLPAPLRKPLFAAAWCVLAVAVLLPVIALARRVETLAALREAWDTAGPELGASAGIGAATATLAVSIAFLVMGLPRRAGLRYVAAAIAAVTFLMPGPALAIALIDAWNHPGWRAAVYDGPAVLVLACAARLVAAGVVVLAVSRVSQSRAWEEAARVAGVSAWRRRLLITLPASAPALAAAWAVVFVLSSREADASVLVAPPGFTTLAVRLLALMHYGPSAVVAALALMVVAAAIAVTAAAMALAWWLKWWVYGPALRT
jgi:iron(III) transport system permease protein